MIIIEIIVSTILGIFIGIFSGLIPGVHINMVSLLVLTLSPFLIHKGISIIALCVFIIALGVTHTYLDAIPSIFLGAPDDNTALGVLPGHRYLLRGNGYMAVKLFTIGSFFGLIAGIIMFPFLYFFTYYSYAFFEKFFAAILIGVSAYMLYRDTKRLWALFVFGLSGIFGIIIFNLSMKDPLFPLLSGLFGISTLLYSLKDDNNIPQQQILATTEINKKQTFQGILLGNLSAFIVSTFPGLSSSIAATMSTQLMKKMGDRGFMILMGCIGTSGFVLSLVSLYAVQKARNGAVIVIAKLSSINLNTVLIFLCVALIAGGVSFALSLFFGKVFSRIISRINYRLVVITVVVFVTTLVTIMTSWLGLIVLVTSTAIGLIPAIVKVQRTQSMACLILPVILYLL
jgi:putative membrane protein